MADHTTYSQDPMAYGEIDKCGSPNLLSSGGECSSAIYQPTNAAILPEAKSSPTVLMAPRTSAPVVTVTRLPRAQVQDLKQCCARCCGVYCSILLFFLPRHYHC